MVKEKEVKIDGRTLRGARTRNGNYHKVLDATVAILEARGLVSVESVADKAELSQTSIRNHCRTAEIMVRQSAEYLIKALLPSSYNDSEKALLSFLKKLTEVIAAAGPMTYSLTAGLLEVDASKRTTLSQHLEWSFGLNPDSADRVARATVGFAIEVGTSRETEHSISEAVLSQTLSGIVSA